METTINAFLGGRLALEQPLTGYRAGIDPVLLAAACDVTPGASVLELGCGVGTALFCLARRVPDLALFGVEAEAELADLARRNADRNALQAEIVTADLQALPPAIRNLQFDAVLANPPFFDRARSSASGNTTREAGRGEVTPLAAWIDVATRRLAPKGRFVLIQRIERLPDVIAACDARLGDLEVIPIQPRDARPARLFLMRAQKGGRAAFCLRPSLILHDGASHRFDGDDYRPEISAVLRGAEKLPVA